MALADRVASQVTQRQITRAADPVSMEEFGYLLGVGNGSTKSKSGITVGPRRALGISAWYSGVLHISTVMAARSP